MQSMTVSIRQSATDGLFKISDADGNHLILEAPIKKTILGKPQLLMPNCLLRSLLKAV